MLRHILSIACLLLLAGCKLEAGLTTVTNVSIDGHAVNATRSVVLGGDGEFACLRSVSGQCHYVLFVDGCEADGRPDKPDGGCGARVLQAFTLTAGETRNLAELPARLKQCVDHDAPPVAPDCAGELG